MLKSRGTKGLQASSGLPRFLSPCHGLPGGRCPSCVVFCFSSLVSLKIKTSAFFYWKSKLYHIKAEKKDDVACNLGIIGFH